MQVDILYVEDNPGEVFLLTNALRKRDEGWKVISCPDGEEALAYLSSAVHLPRVIVLDLGLPRIGGAEVFRTLTANPALAAIPVVIFAEKKARETLTATGAPPDLFLSKPMDLDGYTEIAHQIATLCLSTAARTQAAGLTSL